MFLGLAHDWYVGRAALLLIMALVLAYLLRARAGVRYRIREIPGLRAIEEAVGRAVEMGRPALFCPGIWGLDKVETLAAFPVLERLADLTASLRTRLIIPLCKPDLMPVVGEIVSFAYRKAGEEARPDDIRYLPGGQFYFAAGALAWMLRERPAACVYFGFWEAESLLFGETGLSLGAIQIAGTTQIYQIPFFVATCDHVIIGEEYYAASAAVSGDPNLVGALKGQDIAKLVLMAVLVAGSIAASIGPEAAAFVRALFAP